MTNLLAVDWSKIPPPSDDGGTGHLMAQCLPAVLLPATSGASVDLSALKGRSIVFCYPMTGQPGVALPDGWDDIPGARGCTPQSCAFRDLHAELSTAGARYIFGLSTQTADDQREAASRLHLPFALLSDSELQFSSALGLPTFRVEDRVLIKRMAIVADDGRIAKVFYPVFPPDRNARDVLDWLRANPV